MMKSGHQGCGWRHRNLHGGHGLVLGDFFLVVWMKTGVMRLGAVFATNLGRAFFQINCDSYKQFKYRLVAFPIQV